MAKKKAAKIEFESIKSAQTDGKLPPSNPHEEYMNQQYIKDTKALLSVYVRQLKETVAEKDKTIHFLQNWVDEIAQSNGVGNSSSIADIHKLNAKIDLLQTIICDLTYLCDGW